jgi:hypothetical protein
MNEIAFAAIIVASFFAPEQHPFLVGASFFGLVASASINFNIRVNAKDEPEDSGAGEGTNGERGRGWTK